MTWVRRAAVLAVVVLAAVLLGAPAAQAAVVDRTITDGRITESSGLALSLLHPGVLWTHNDSGHPPQLFAIGTSGATKATIRVAGEQARDWEAITSLRQPGTGTPLIAIGDIGDNDWDHPSIRIAILREPRDLRSQTIAPQRVLRLVYPGGPRDAEALLADPRNGRLYIVSKTLLGTQIFEVPPSAWPGTTTGTSGLVTLQLVASSNAMLVTDGCFLPDGRMVVRGYGMMYVLARPEDVHDGRIATIASAGLPLQDQGESLVVIDSGRKALIGSEGHREPVLRVTIPAVGDLGTDLDTSTPSPAARTSPSSSVAPAAAAPDLFPGKRLGIQGRIWVALAAGAAAIAILVGTAVSAFTRRRRY